MARYFSAGKIEEFKEYFDFHCRRGYIASDGDLSIIMRSLGYSPTREEIIKYFRKYVTGDGQLDFASFLEVMHDHCSVENCQRELQEALEAQDVGKTGFVDATQVYTILTSIGEQLSRTEVDTLFREAGIKSGSKVKIEDLVRVVMTPSPDY